MADLSQTIDVRNRASFEAALQIIATDRGMNDMESIRTLAQRLTAGENAKLAEHLTTRRERSSRSGFINIGGGVALLGLLIFSAVMIHRATTRREQLIALLRQDDIRLRELRQQAEGAEGRVRDILESIADGFVSFDRSFAIAYVNSAAEKIFGCPQAELLGKDFRTEFPEDAAVAVEEHHRKVIETGKPVTFETFSPARNQWWEQSIYPAKDNSFSVFFRDVSERKRFEERARHSQKLESLGVLAGGIAHDFNNLLTAILGGASLTQEELPPDSPAASHLKIVLNAGERASQLTRQMLAYSGRGRFVVQPIDLSHQVLEITELLNSSVTRDIELIFDLNTNGILVEADTGQIQQLVVNLVINGAEAIESGMGTVVVSTRLEQLDEDYVRDNLADTSVEPGPYVLLQVHDTGKGMDEATLSRIFDPFFTTKFTGRGLGLAAVIGIVRGHRGALKVYSHPGQGTTFKVFLPVASREAAHITLPESAEPVHGSNETVLVVDDEEPVQHLAKAALKKYGYQVIQAHNGQEAIEVAKQNKDSIDLVLLDMTMPVMNGEETMKHLRELSPTLPIIATSGYNEIEALRRFGDGVSGFLQKPYRAVTLAEKVKGALTRRKSEVT